MCTKFKGTDWHRQIGGKKLVDEQVYRSQKVIEVSKFLVSIQQKKTNNQPTD